MTASSSDRAAETTVKLLPLPTDQVRGWMSDERERVRFVLRAQLHGAGVTQSRLIKQFNLELRQKQLTKNRLSRILTSGDILASDLELIRTLEHVAIHNSVTSRFAERIVETQKLDHRGDSRWWLNSFSSQGTYTTALEVIVAGLSLLRHVDEVGMDFARSKLANSMARRTLATALCRVASGSFGHAHDAMTIIARLGPLIADDVADFIVASPMGMWVARAADGALRRSDIPDEAKAGSVLFKKYAAAAAALTVDSDTPSRCISHIRLDRRLALDAVGDDRTNAVARLATIAEDRSMPARWRRFALWVSAEPAVRAPDLYESKFQKLCESVKGDVVVDDVVRQLMPALSESSPAAQRAGYKSWAGDPPYKFDLTAVDHRNEWGAFDWPLPHHHATDLLLREFTLRGYEGVAPSITQSTHLSSVGPDIRLRLLDVLHEALIHCGHIRVQAAIDMLSAAGDGVIDAIVLTLEQMVQQGDLLAREHEHLPSFLDALLQLLGRTRRPSAMRSLLAVGGWQDAHLRASTAWAIGDVVSGSEAALDEHELRVTELLHDYLNSPEVVVQRAALHAIAVSGLQKSFRWEVEALANDSDVSDWARWCLLTWSGNYLSTPATRLVA